MASPEGAGVQRHVLERAGLSVTVETTVQRALPRFDETAAVSAITWRGQEWLAGDGLVDEFGLEGLGVLAFAETGDGGEFIKIGVGVLKRDRPGDYRFQHPYARLENFPVRVAVGPGDLRVMQRSREVHGYRYDYIKAYRIDDEGGLTIGYALTNSGRRRFQFEHYNHNFFSVKLGGGPKHFRFEAPVALPPPPEGWLLLSDRVARWCGEEVFERGKFWRIPLDPPVADHSLTLSFDRGYTVRMAGSSAVVRLAIWMEREAICPELFSHFTLEPGETARWTRTYRFAELDAEGSAE